MGWVNVFGLVSAIFIMSVVCEFRWTTFELITHTDIAFLHILGILHCTIMVMLHSNIDKIWSWATQYTASMETLAYMPAAWMLCHTSQNLLAFEPLSQVVSQRQAIWFLVWTVAFNIY